MMIDFNEHAATPDDDPSPPGFDELASLTGLVGHDINNALVVINCALDGLALAGDAVEPEVTEDLERVGYLLRKHARSLLELSRTARLVRGRSVGSTD